MANVFSRILNDQSQDIRSKVVSMYALLVVANIILWGLTLFISTKYAVVMGTGLLAFTFGLRHGVDADHVQQRGLRGREVHARRGVELGVG